MINIKDIYWLAGFLEGEGCFMMAKIKTRPMAGRPTIVITQKQKWPLERVQNIIKHGSICFNKYSKGYWQYQVSSRLAIQWMMTVYSLMSPRRQDKIKEIIKYWKNIPLTGRHHK